MRHIAVFGSVLVTLLFSVSCKEKTSNESDSPSSSEVSASESITAAVAPNGLAEEQFDAALRNMSTAPNYVVFSVAEGNSNLTEDACVTAMDFLAAVCRELELGLQDAQEYALSKVDRTYRFSNPQAIQVFSRNYTEAMLTEARLFFVNMTVQEIEATIRANSDKFILGGPEPGSTAPHGKLYATVAAHALAERGILSVRGCLGEFRLDGRNTQHADR